MTGLSVSGLRVERSGRRVLHDVSVDIPEARVTALVGPNGAGKSTLVLALAGLLPTTDGAVELDGRSLVGLRPEARRAAGMAAVPEGHRVLTKLDVEENLRVAAGRGDGIDRAWEVFPELERMRTRRAGSLSGGEQQMLALAQALVSRPRVMLVDEMSLGLAPTVVRRLVDVIVALADDGIGVLLIEQFTNVALDIAAHLYVLDRGTIRFGGTPTELTAHPELLDTTYLGPSTP